jgi:hypothetical protein
MVLSAMFFGKAGSQQKGALASVQAMMSQVP